MKRIALITFSLKAFVYAWLAFLPVLGTGFWIASAINLRRSGKKSPDDWNPAQRYRVFAALLLLFALPVCITGTAGLLKFIIFLAS
jgi:uncharacterized membrane protein YraQ (UPF0718 family)